MARDGGCPGLISILCPTRKRPQRVVAMVHSALKTAGQPSQLEFVFYVDDDDRTIYNVEWPRGIRMRVREGPRQIQPNNWNHAYEWSRGEILMMGADDLLFVSEGWDERVRGAFDMHPDRIVLVYADDRRMHDRPVQATHPFLHRRWIETLGYAFPPYFEVYWVDQWLQEVADRIGRRVYLENVSIEHVHWMGGRVEKDATYSDAQEWEGRAKPAATWVRTAEERVRDAAKLQRAIDSFAREPEHAALLRA